MDKGGQTQSKILNYSQICKLLKTLFFQWRTLVFIFIPNVILLVITVVIDYLIRQEIKLAAQPAERKKLEKIPRQAALINFVFALFWISLSFIRVFLNAEDRIVFSKFVFYGVSASRNYLVSRFAFRINEQIKKDDVNARRQAEIELAMKARDDRRKQRMEVDHGQDHNVQAQDMPPVEC